MGEMGLQCSSLLLKNLFFSPGLTEIEHLDLYHILIRFAIVLQ